MTWSIQKSKAERVSRACARFLLRWSVCLFLLSLMSGSALAAGTINYTGTLFVDNGYGGGISGNGVQDGGEIGVAWLANISVNYTLTNAGGSTNTGSFNTSTNGSGGFTFSIANVQTGYSLTQLVFNRSDSFINAYVMSAGTTGSIKGTLTATSAAQVTMTWPTGTVASGANVTGGFVGLIGNTSIGGDVFMNNGPAGGEAGNQVQDADEPGFTAFPVAIVVTYVDLATNQPMTLNLTSNSTTGVYPTFMVPKYTQNLKFLVDNAQFNNAGYFVNAISPPSNGTSLLQIGDGQPSQACSQVTLNGVWGTFTGQYQPCYANLNPTIVTIGTVNQGETAVSFGAVLFNTLISTTASSTQVVVAGTPATYEYKYTSYSSDMRLNFVLTGGTNPVFYIKEPSGNTGNPDCAQPYDTTSTGPQYLNWGAQIFPGKVVCIEVLDTPASNNPDQVTLNAIYQYNTMNNPWTIAKGSALSATSVAGYAVSGTVFVDDGSGAGSIANDSIMQSKEPLYAAGATITATYTYIGVGGVSTPGTSSTTTNGLGAFTLVVPTKATNVKITRSGWASYIGTGGNGGTSTVRGIYARGATPTAGDTVTITTLSDGVSGIAFGIVELDTLATTGTNTTAPGTTIYYPHTFTAYTGGRVTFSSSDLPNAWTSVLNDPTCSGVYVSSAKNPVQGAVTNSTATTSAPWILCVLEAVTVPGTATAGTDVATVSASYAYLNGATTVFTYVVTATDTTTVTTTLSGTVYIDANHDGNFDVGDAVYSTTPTLYAKLFISGMGTAVAVVTVTSGTFSFAVPGPAGTYTIHLSTSNSTTSSTETPPPGYFETQNAGGYTFVRTSGGQTGINFGLYSGSTVSGLVFIDNGAGTGGVAGDGIQNGSETGASGVVVSEAASVGSPCTTSVCRTTTATDGTFTLYVPSGQASAIISRTAVTGYVAVKGKAGTTTGTWAASPEAVTFAPVAGTTTYTGLTFGDVYMSVTVVKTANMTSANPGDTIIYTLQYANLMDPSLVVSSIAMGGLTIVDAVPANTTFVSGGGVGCGGVPANSGLTSCTLVSPAVGGTGNVTWTFAGSLKPNYTGTVTLSVKVK